MKRLLPVLVYVGCGIDTGLTRGKLPDPAPPPGRVFDLWGKPPTDWQNCYHGLHGMYYNLTPDHPDVEVDPASPDDTDAPQMTDLDWWDGEPSFQRYDGNLDFGANWWPVDTGFAGDPQYFAARWVGWVRVTQRNGEHNVVMGATNDAWLALNDEIRVEILDNDDFETSVAPVGLSSGVYRLDLRYAHRRGLTNGFRFRIASDDVIVCYPEYVTDE
jgi:hypothetical protein